MADIVGVLRPPDLFWFKALIAAGHVTVTATAQLVRIVISPCESPTVCSCSHRVVIAYREGDYVCNRLSPLCLHRNIRDASAARSVSQLTIHIYTPAPNLSGAVGVNGQCLDMALGSVRRAFINRLTTCRNLYHIHCSAATAGSSHSHRRQRPRPLTTGLSNTKLAAPVITPGIHCTVSTECNTEISACRELNDLAQILDLFSISERPHSFVAIRRSSNTQLTLVIAAPSIYLAIFCQGQGVISTSCNSNYTVQFFTIRFHYFARIGNTVFCTVYTYLSASVVAPRPNSTITA